MEEEERVGPPSPAHTHKDLSPSSLFSNADVYFDSGNTLFRPLFSSFLLMSLSPSFPLEGETTQGGRRRGEDPPPPPPHFYQPLLAQREEEEPVFLLLFLLLFVLFY